MSRFFSESEVAGDDGQRRRAMATVGAIDGGKGDMVIRAPLQFPEPHLATEGDPVADGTDEGVFRCAFREGSDVVYHAVRDHLIMFRYCFILFNGIGCYFNVINIG